MSAIFFVSLATKAGPMRSLVSACTLPWMATKQPCPRAAFSDLPSWGMFTAMISSATCITTDCALVATKQTN